MSTSFSWSFILRIGFSKASLISAYCAGWEAFKVSLAQVIMSFSALYKAMWFHFASFRLPFLRSTPATVSSFYKWSGPCPVSWQSPGAKRRRTSG